MESESNKRFLARWFDLLVFVLPVFVLPMLACSLLADRHNGQQGVIDLSAVDPIRTALFRWLWHWKNCQSQNR
jgi:hypothetical protein